MENVILLVRSNPNAKNYIKTKNMLSIEYYILQYWQFSSIDLTINPPSNQIILRKAYIIIIFSTQWPLVGRENIYKIMPFNHVVWPFWIHHSHSWAVYLYIYTHSNPYKPDVHKVMWTILDQTHSLVHIHTYTWLFVGIEWNATFKF